MSNQLIIIGGGFSIREGIEKGLWQRLQNHFVIGTNFSYNHFPNPTVQCYVDKDFYEKNVEGLKNLPLIIGKKHTFTQLLPNTIMLETSSKYNPNILLGVYSPSLVGLFALSLSIYVLSNGTNVPENSTIFLLGFDFTGEPSIKDNKGRELSHYYQGQIEHRGIGKVSYYSSKGRAERDFKPYLETKIKIFNVSLISKIPVFQKISYDEFFSMLSMEEINQEVIRKEIKFLLNKS